MPVTSRIILLMMALASITSSAQGQRRTPGRSSFSLSIGPHYSIPTGERTLPYTAIHGRQGDPTLEGFRYTPSFGYHGSLVWTYDFGKAFGFAGFLGCEWYTRADRLEGDHTFIDRSGRPVHISRRVWRSRDLQTPLGVVWSNPSISVMAGVRMLWHYAYVDIAYDGQERSGTMAKYARTYPWQRRGYYPFVRLGHEFTAGRKFRVGVYSGIERRGWSNDRTNWWDVELGVFIRLPWRALSDRDG